MIASLYVHLKKKEEKVEKKTITKSVELGYLGTGETKTSVTRSRRKCER